MKAAILDRGLSRRSEPWDPDPIDFAAMKAQLLHTRVRSLAEIDREREAAVRGPVRRKAPEFAPPEGMVQAVAAFQRWAAEDEERETACLHVFPDGSGSVVDADDVEVVDFDSLDAAMLELGQLDPVALRKDPDPGELVALVREELRLDLEVRRLKASRGKCEVSASEPCYSVGRDLCPACRDSARISREARTLAGRRGSIKAKMRALVAG